MTDSSEEIEKDNECLQCGTPCIKEFCSQACLNYYNE